MRLLGLLLVTAACHAQAQMYKCVDERGVTRYTDSAAPGCKEVAIRGSPPISGSIQAPSEDLARKEAEFRRRQVEREEGAAREQQAAAQRCMQLRREQTILATSRRIVRMNEKGEATYVEDAARDQRLADVQRELARCP